MFGQPGFIIGQIIGMLAVVTGFISYQMKTTKGILSFQILTALFFSAHYFLIGANTAAVVNFMAVISCTCYYIRNRRGSRSLWVPIVFISLNWIIGILTWDGWISLLLLLGLTANGVGLAINKPQAIRKFYLIKAPFCLAYNALVFSWGGVIYEIATLTSAIIALIRDRTPKAPAAQRTDADEKV